MTSNIKRYKTYGVIELSVTLFILVGLIFVYKGMGQTIENQIVFHAIYFTVLSIVFYLVAILVHKEEYIYTYQDRAVPIKGCNFFKYLVFDGFKKTPIKTLSITTIIAALLTLLILDPIGANADYNFHRIKLIILALLFAIYMLPMFAEPDKDGQEELTKEESAVVTAKSAIPTTVDEAREFMHANPTSIIDLGTDLKTNYRYSASHFSDQNQLDPTMVTEGDFPFAQAVIEFVTAGIIRYPNDACLSEAIENIESNDGKDVLIEVLRSSQFVRNFSGYKPDILNTEFHYLALDLCAPEYKLEGIWEQDSDTPKATLHWIIDNKHYCETTYETRQQTVADDLQVNLANSVLENLHVKPRVILGESDDLAAFWFFEPAILCPLFDKYDMEYYV